MENFRAFRIHDNDGNAGIETLHLDDLSDGDVVIRAEYSSVNYKDALAATGTGRILKKFPLIGGIDVAGEVMSSENAAVTVGDKVVVTGCGLGETRDGGYAEYVRVEAASVLALPDSIDTYQAMCLGTAGFTAALAIHKMELNGQKPELGPVVVTGASGGVGSLAVNMLAGCGYEVTAVTGKPEATSYLEELGASNFLLREGIDYGSRPMEKAVWAGAVDNVGGDMLTWLTRTVKYGGNIASIGLAGGFKLNTTVMPFILRGINLLGINSVDTPRNLRLEVWQRLASDLKPSQLERIAGRTVPLDELSGVFQGFMDGTIQGRTVVQTKI